MDSVKFSQKGLNDLKRLFMCEKVYQAWSVEIVLLLIYCTIKYFPRVYEAILNVSTNDTKFFISS